MWKISFDDFRPCFLQGNEIHPRDVLREHNDNKSQDRVRTISTPGRIKALFTRSSTNTSSSSSSQRNNDTEVGKHQHHQQRKQHCLYAHCGHSLVPLLAHKEPPKKQEQIVHHIPHTCTRTHYCTFTTLQVALLIVVAAFVYSYYSTT